MSCRARNARSTVFSQLWHIEPGKGHDRGAAGGAELYREYAVRSSHDDGALLIRENVSALVTQSEAPAWPVNDRAWLAAAHDTQLSLLGRCLVHAPLLQNVQDRALRMSI